MRLAKNAYGMVLATVLTPLVAVSAAAQVPANDVHAPSVAQASTNLDMPISDLRSGSYVFSQGRKRQIYDEAADLFLSKIKATHPELLAEFMTYLKSPLADHGGAPYGYLVYQGTIDKLVSDGSNISQANPYNVLASIAKTHYREQQAKQPAPANPTSQHPRLDSLSSLGSEMPLGESHSKDRDSTVKPR